MEQPSKLQIYNMALGFLGTRTIGSPNEHTPEAIQCELYWDRARRTALRDYPYNFAQRRFALAQKIMPDVYRNDWEYCYGLPDGVVKVMSVHDGKDTIKRNKFAIESTDEGRIILSDIPDAIANCTIDVEEVSKWDDAFVLAMARNLAFMVGTALLKNNGGKVQELAQLYRSAIPAAEVQNANERTEREEPDAWLQARETW